MMNPDPQNLEQMYYDGVKSFENGDLQSALKVFERILAAEPNQIETNYQMGRLLLRSEKPKDGLKYFERITLLAPRNLEFWKALMSSYAGLGMRKQANRALKRLKTGGFTSQELAQLKQLIEASGTEAAIDIGNAPQSEIVAIVGHMNSGDLEVARTKVIALEKKAPNVAFVQNLFGVILIQAGELKKAGSHFEKALILDPFFLDALNNFGKILILLGQHEDAIVSLSKALKISPEFVGAKINLAEAYIGNNQAREAAIVLDAVLARDPDNETARCLLATSFFTRKMFQEALENFDLLDRKSLSYLDKAANISDALVELGRSEEAIDRLNSTLDSSNNKARILYLLGVIFGKIGNFSAAEDAHRRSLKFDGSNVGAFHHLGTIHKWQSNDPLIEEMIVKFESGDLLAEEKVTLGFALGKALADIGRHESVFDYLNVANGLHRETLDYSSDDVSKDFEEVRQIFTNKYFETLTNHGPTCDDDTPIFVLGMPRSGSTLTEQIISNHRDVEGAGEIASILTPIRRLVELPDSIYKKAADISAKDLQKVGLASVQTLRQVFPDAVRITDKMLHAFIFVGFIRVALPNAKIVHIHRNPIDNCLSIYKNRFAKKGHRYAYDLRELGQYYSHYHDLMKYWDKMFPGQIIDVDYDKLVNDQEVETRKLIAALGLDWDDACLNTQSNKRNVKTLSIYQARQKVYKSSVKGWKKYENDLTELVTALEQGGAI